MNTLPEKYIDTKTIPMSLMVSGTEYTVYYSDLLLDVKDRLWVERDHTFSTELGRYEEEYDQVYIMRSKDSERGLIVRIPPTFSKRKKWSREDEIDSTKYIMVAEIIEG